MRSTTFAAVLVAALCVVGTAAALPTDAVRSPQSQLQHPQQPQQAQQAQQGIANPNATLVFTDQTTNGSVVRLNTATLSQGGFVAIHDTSLTTNNSTVGSVIGVSQRLSPGPHQDVVVELYSVDGRSFNESRLVENGTLIAMAHFDSNDNGEFDFVETNGSADGPYVEGTRAVTDSATISVRPATGDAESGGSGILGGLGPIIVTAVLVVILALFGGAAVVARRRQRDGRMK